VIALHRELPAKLGTPSMGTWVIFGVWIGRAGAPEPGRARFAPTSAMSRTEARRVTAGSAVTAAAATPRSVTDVMTDADD
jgi:hypothetical protein